VLKGEKMKQKIISLLLEHGCLNTMEICRGLNNKDIFNPRFCGIPEYMKPFENRGKILEQYRWQTGNGKCLHYRECNPNYDKVSRILKTMHIKTVKMKFWDDKARIKKEMGKMDTFRFWFINYEDFKKRVLIQTLIPYVEEVKV
jgi:hypothetical protein